MPVSEDSKPANQAFVQRFGKMYPNRVPGSEAQWNYTAVHATAKAMQLAGTYSDAKAIHTKLDAAYKALAPDVNPGGVLGVDAQGGTLTHERGAAVKDGKIEAISTVN
jgi:branched-chain amino acid transport system substrate-binding protein